MEESNMEIKSSLKMNIFFLADMQVGTIRSRLKSVYNPRSISFVARVKVLAMMMVSQGLHDTLKFPLLTCQRPDFSVTGPTGMYQKLFLALLVYNFKTEIVSFIFVFLSTCEV